MDLNNAAVLILGLGASGEHSARLASAQGANVTIVDDKPAAELEPVLDRLAGCAGLSYRLADSEADLRQFDLVVRSPGITNATPVLHAARTAGVPVWSELELAWRHCPCPVIAVTGTNGKGTTTTLTADILRTMGRTAHVAGNIGIPLAEILPIARSRDVAVVEVSHVHLEDSPTFAPTTSVITNIRPEHGALYPFDYYKRLKARITANHTAGSSTVVPYDDLTARELTDHVPGRLLYTRLSGRIPGGLDGVFIEDSHIVATTDGQETILCCLDDLQVRGALPNLLQAAAAAWLWDAGPDDVTAASARYPGREHVMEFVGQRGGINYYNDAKATNPYSTLHALQSLPDQQVVLIAGGKDDKGGDFNVLGPQFAQVAHVIAFGQTATDLGACVAASTPSTPITQVKDFEAAVNIALNTAQPGQAVLLSPGTHSWSMSPGYLERGEIFKAHVRGLATSETSEASNAGRDQTKAGLLRSGS